MKLKTYFVVLLLFVLGCVSSGQKTRLPLMFWFQLPGFTIEQTDFCKKYKCDQLSAKIPKGFPYSKDASVTPLRYDPNKPPETKDGYIIERYELKGYGDKLSVHPEFNSYRIETIRKPIPDGTNRYWFTYVKMELPRGLRINPKIQIGQAVISVVNDFNKLFAGNVMLKEKQIRSGLNYPESLNLVLTLPKSSEVGRYNLSQGGAGDGAPASSGQLSFKAEYPGGIDNYWVIQPGYTN